MVEKLLRERDPSHIAVVFDLPGPTFRHDAFPKLTRPTALRLPGPVGPVRPGQGDPARHGLARRGAGGLRADGCIATLAKKAVAEGMENWSSSRRIRTSSQLVRPGVRILHEKGGRVPGRKGVEEVFGVPPERVVDVLALWGDSTDNIPGVPGIGKKGARSW